MGRKAVDVVLLPDEQMTRRAIEANARLVEKFGGKIALDKKDCLPHISLAMGGIDERDIGCVEKIFQELAERCILDKLKAVGVRTSINSRGEKVSVFEVQKTPQLQSLHQVILQKVEPYFDHHVTEEMLYSDEQVAETTLQWINSYPEKASYSRFFPHITIGYGELQQQGFPIEFNASELALCHLGNHCTCRKVIVSVPLTTV